MSHCVFMHSRMAERTFDFIGRILYTRRSSQRGQINENWAESSYIMPIYFLFLSSSTHAKSGWAKPLLPYIQPKQQITDCPSNPMHQGMCHCHHAPTIQSSCSHCHQSWCSASCTPPLPHTPAFCVYAFGQTSWIFRMISIRITACWKHIIPLEYLSLGTP